MIEKLLMKLSLRDVISPSEEERLRALPAERQTIERHRTIAFAGREVNQSIIVVNGLLCRYKDLRNGGRQISGIHIAGDFADLHGFTLKRLDDSILAMTRCEIALVPHERLRKLTEECPHLTRLLWFTTNLDAAIHREWVLSLGRRSALQRMAHFFCELWVRHDIVGLAQPDGFALGMTQNELAECMGLTPVHVNRTLKLLREMDLARFRNGYVEIPGLDELKSAAEFDDTYLSLESRPR